MNKRIKKKINKRLGCKTYFKYREKLIVDLVWERFGLNPEDRIFIARSRNGKYISKIKILKSVEHYIPDLTNQCNQCDNKLFKPIR